MLMKQLTNHGIDRFVDAEVQENLKLTIPLAIAQIFESLILLIDIITMGFLGSEVIGAGFLGNMTIRFFLSVGICLAYPVGIFIATAQGNKEHQDIPTITAQGFYLIAIYSLIVIFLLANEGTILSYFKPLTESQLDTISYVHTVLYGFPAAIAFLLLQNVLTSLGKPRIITITLLISIFLNALFNYIFAFGKLGFPAMGLVGIAWATTLVFWMQLIIVLIYIICRPKLKTYRILNQLHLFDRQTFKKIISLGWPIGLQVMVEMGFLVSMGYIASSLDKVSFNAFEAAKQAPEFLSLVFISMEQATTTRVAYTLGQSNYHSIRKSGLTGIIVGVVFAIICTLIFIIKSQFILHFFIHSHNDFDVQVIEKSSRVLKFIAIGKVGDAIRMITCGALRGIKDTFYPLFVFSFCYALLGLVLVFLFVSIFKWGVIGLVLTIVVSSSLSGFILIKRFLTQTKILIVEQ